MLVAVSPYHLTTREPAAIAALLLAERVVTLIPGSDRRSAEQAAARSPHYLDFVMSWEWSVPLWEEGLITGAIDGHEASRDVRAAYAKIHAEECYSPLRSLMRPELLDAEDEYLDAIARDLLKGGPDPAISVPLAAGMDQFAIRCGASVARSHPTSVVQVAESKLGSRAFAFAAPVLLQAGAESLLMARELLEPELTELRLAIGAMTNPALRTNGHANIEPAERLEAAASKYARAFDRQREDLLATEGDELRVVDGVVAITGLVLPGDAVFTSSLAALGAMSGIGANGNGNGKHAPAAANGALGHAHVLSLLVKVLGRAPASRR